MRRPFHWWQTVSSDMRPLVRAACLLALTLGSGIALLATSAWLIATAAGRPSIAVIGTAVVGVRAFGLTRAAARYAERLVSHRATLELLGRLRVALFRALVPLGPAWMAGRGRGDVVTRLVPDVEILDGVVLRLVLPVAASSVVGLGVVLCFGLVAWPLAALVAVGLLTAGVVIPGVALARSMPVERQSVTERAALSDTIVTSLSGRWELAVFDSSHRTLRHVLRQGHRLASTQFDHASRSSAIVSLGQCASDLTAMVVLIVATDLASKAGISRVLVAVIVIATLAAFELAQVVGQSWQGLGAYDQAASRIEAILNAPPAIHSLEPIPLPSDDCALSLRHVSFAYPGEPQQALVDFSLDLSVGRTVALVGGSGSGKSTVLALLARTWETEQGLILLGDRDVRHLEIGRYRASLSFATQPSTLLTGTIRENLCIGHRDNTDAALWRALSRVGLSGEATQWADGLDSWIGEHGMSLSGGQQQRLCVARALLRPSRFLLLDEPTAHLDTGTEQLLFRTLAEERQFRGLLLTSHQLAGLDWVDEIVVLHEGRVVERGCFGELACGSGWFSQMLALQRSRIVMS